MLETKWRHFINLHKLLTAFVIWYLMYQYQVYTYTSYLYLGMHGSYRILWLMKELWYPDRSWMKPLSLLSCIGGFFVMCAYWIAPFLICYRNHQASNMAILLSTMCFTFGLFFHFGSDCQKHFTLKLKKGLITDGFFSYTRNPNYLGEILIYSGFMALSGSIIPFVVLFMVSVFMFYPNMRNKDKSMERHEGFKAYKQKTGFLIPNFWRHMSS